MESTLCCAAGYGSLLGLAAFQTQLHGGGTAGQRIQASTPDDKGSQVLHGPAKHSQHAPTQNKVTFQDQDGDEVTFLKGAQGRLLKYVNGKFSRIVTSLTFQRRNLRIEDQDEWGGSPYPNQLAAVCRQLRPLALECKVSTNLPQKPNVPRRTHCVTISYNTEECIPEIRTLVGQAIDILQVDIPGVFWVCAPAGQGDLRITSKPDDGCWSHVGKHFPFNESNLDPTWAGGVKGRNLPLGTVLHELLHGLGMSHQHQRDDRDGFVFIDPEAEEHNSVNLAVDADVHPYRYDTASIMHYPSSDTIQSGCAAWSDFGQRTQLSQLDKFFMNVLYPPADDSFRYEPRRGKTGLWYCGRPVMQHNNFPYGRVGCDGRCGPTNGPNCPSCIVYGISRGDSYPLVSHNGRIQGDTGLFYCGKWMGQIDRNHDGYCGPHNGPCCSECFELVYMQSGCLPAIHR